MLLFVCRSGPGGCLVGVPASSWTVRFGVFVIVMSFGGYGRVTGQALSQVRILDPLPPWRTRAQTSDSGFTMLSGACHQVGIACNRCGESIVPPCFRALRVQSALYCVFCMFARRLFLRLVSYESCAKQVYLATPVSGRATLWATLPVSGPTGPWHAFFSASVSLLCPPLLAAFADSRGSLAHR